MKKKININLISHASGELVEMLARNAVTQLEGVEVKRRLWKMVRRLDQVPQILTELETSPGFVIHSISHDDVREALEEGCRQLHIPFQFALEPLIGRLAKFSDAPVKYYTSSGDAFDEDYYRRQSEEALQTWQNCYDTTERIAYIREHESQFEFRDYADMLGCVRGKWFCGDEGELLL